MVWRFLFGMYPCSSTTLERALLLEEMSIRYHVMKRKWQRLLPGAVRLRLNGTDGKPHSKHYTFPHYIPTLHYFKLYFCITYSIPL